MSDKLIVEIDLKNNNAEDALAAVIHVANELAHSPTIHIRDDGDFEFHEEGAYRVRWWFEEGDRE